MCDQLAEQQRDGLTGRQEQATGPLRMPSWPALRGKVVAFRRRERVPCWSRSSKLEILGKVILVRFAISIAALVLIGAWGCGNGQQPVQRYTPPETQANNVTIERPPPAEEDAKNVILFLGDGTGVATVHAASVFGHGKPQAFYIHSMPHVGLSETSAASTWNTDSAAGMTAIVTGQKTHTGVVSQGPDSERGIRDGTPLKTILEYAEERGLATGVVSNSPITDATPAACYAHSNDRRKWGEVFSQIVHPRFGDGVDVVIGPGREPIMTQTSEIGFDVAAKLAARGYKFLDRPDNLGGADAGTDRLVALFGKEPQDFDLAQAADTALTILERNSNGFFLMVESNNHYTDIRKSLDLMVRFDEIIRRTAERMKGTQTLILFTADHSYDLHFPLSAVKGEDILPSMAVVGKHTAEEVLVLAQGPGAERVHGFFPNTHLFHVMMSAYGWVPD